MNSNKQNLEYTHPTLSQVLRKRYISICIVFATLHTMCTIAGLHVFLSLSISSMLTSCIYVYHGMNEVINTKLHTPITIYNLINKITIPHHTSQELLYFIAKQIHPTIDDKKKKHLYIILKLFIDFYFLMKKKIFYTNSA